MNVCLATATITAEFTTIEELENESIREGACQPQLGVLSLAAVLEERKDSVGIVDLDQAFLRNVSQGRDFAQAAAEEMAQAALVDRSAFRALLLRPEAYDLLEIDPGYRRITALARPDAVAQMRFERRCSGTAEQGALLRGN